MRSYQNPDPITLNLHTVNLIGLRAKVGAGDVALGVLAGADDLKAIFSRIVNCIARRWHQLSSALMTPLVQAIL